MKTLIRHTLTLGTLLVAAMACGSSENLSDAGKLASGNDALCHLSKSGKLRCWGFSPEYNTTGGVPHREAFVAQHGEEGAYSIPYDVFPEWRFLDVAMAERSTCAIRDDGMLFCWGDQAWGQKGGLAADGTREGLVQVGNDTDWRTIAGDADIDGATYCASRPQASSGAGAATAGISLGRAKTLSHPMTHHPFKSGLIPTGHPLGFTTVGLVPSKMMAPSGAGATPWVPLPDTTRVEAIPIWNTKSLRRPRPTRSSSTST